MVHNSFNSNAGSPVRNDELYEPTAFASLPAAAQHSPLGFVTPPKCPNASQIAIEEQLGFGSFCTVHRIRAVVESYRQIQHLRGAEHVNDDEDNGKIEENGKSEGNHGFDVGQGSRNSSSAKCMSSGGGDVGGLNCDAAAALKLLAPTEGGIMGRDCSESPQDQSQRLEDQPSPLPQTDGTTMRIPSTIAQFPPPSSLLQDRVATTEERVVAVADAQANDGKTSIAELHNEPATESACVIKTLRNDLSQKMQLRGEMDIIIEAHVLSKVQHPNIVQLQTYSKAISEELTRFTRRRRRCSEVCSAGVDEEEDDHICFDFDNASDGSCSTSSSSSLAATNLQSPKALAFMYPTKEYFLIEERLYGTLQDFLRTYKLQLQISSSSLANKNEQYLQQQSMYPLSLSNSTTAVISTSKRWITSSLSGIMSLLVAGGRHGRTNSSLTDGGIADMSSSRLSLSPKKLIVSPNNDDATTNMSGKINHCNNKKDNFHLGIQMLARRIGIARDIASALQYLHDRKIVYRDLKPENIGFSARGIPKLFDFGMCKELLPEYKCPTDTPIDMYRLTGNTGSVRYMAPEVAKSDPYNESVDTYSFGIMLWQMLSLQTPFRDINAYKLHYESVVLGHVRPRIDEDKCWPKELIDLMELCWAADPCVRPHMKICVDLLDDLLLRKEVSGRSAINKNL